MNETDSPKIERAGPDDAGALRDLATRANIDAWTEAGYLEEINRSDSFVLKAVAEGKICGFLVARTVPGSSEDPDIDLYNIAVDPSRRRAGLGSKLMGRLLMELAETRIENIWLEVRRSNADAIRFYEKFGFLAELTRPNFYANPIEDAVIMRLRLRDQFRVNNA